jgi:hypothetical protein
VLADEKLTAFLELETAIRPTSAELELVTKPALANQKKGAKRLGQESLGSH